MASSRGKTLLNSRGQRTNSLGYAKHDCHTCSARKRYCDRQRPQCGTCLSDGQKCGGFALNLVWKGFDAPTSPQALASNLTASNCNDTKSSRGFKFVKGQMRRKRKPKDSTPALHSSSPPGDSGRHPQNMHRSPYRSYYPPQSTDLDNDIPLSSITDEMEFISSDYADGLKQEVYQAGEFEPVFTV